MNYIKSIGKILNQLSYMLTARQRKTGIAVTIMIAVGSFLETLGVSAILPFIEAILTPEEAQNKWYVKIVQRILHFSDMGRITIVIGICIIFVYFLKNAYIYFSTIIHTSYRSKIQKYLSTKMLRSYMNRSYEFFTSINTAEVQRSIGTDIMGVYDLMDNLFRFVGEFLTALFIGAFLIETDAFMAICIIVIAGACFMAITVGLKKKTSYYGEQKRIKDKERVNCSLQAISGFKEIKVTQTTDYFVDAYDEAYEQQRVAEVKNEYIANLPERIIESMCVAVLMGIICIRIAMGANMTTFIPKLSVFAVAAFRLLPSVSRMSRYTNGIIFYNPFLQSAYENLKEIDQYDKNVRSGQSELEKEKNDNRYIPFNDEVRISHIDWKYSRSEKMILSDLSLSIHKGQAIGLVGASGAGKTTLADILLGLLKPKKGTVYVDGMDIFQYPKQWSKIIGYVPQSIFLSDDTIRNNVAFGHAPSEINDNDVWNALREAQLEEYIKSLPEGLDTQVGERGIKFSGGQRQRIAIARTLYNNPEIIVLDEATSALDNETEKAVMESIDALQGYKTLIIVAHRLTTIRHCDKIYEIANGKAIERTWDEIAGENNKSSQ